MKTHLMIHHSLTKDSKTVSWQAIRDYHLSKGWRDVGYHLGVEMVGDRYEVLMGRPLNARAAAAYQQQMNERAIHVCFVGNYDETVPPVGMLRYAAQHLTPICEAFNIAIDDAHVIGHRKVAPKSCPGNKFAVSSLISIMRGV